MSVEGPVDVLLLLHPPGADRNSAGRDGTDVGLQHRVPELLLELPLLLLLPEPGDLKKSLLQLPLSLRQLFPEPVVFVLDSSHLQPQGSPVRLQPLEVVGQADDDGRLLDPDLQLLQALGHVVDPVLQETVLLSLPLLLLLLRLLLLLLLLFTGQDVCIAVVFALLPDPGQDVVVVIAERAETALNSSGLVDNLVLGQSSSERRNSRRAAALPRAAAAAAPVITTIHDGRRRRGV